MDNLITGLFAVVVFLAFVIGLAESINALPFTIIVGCVGILLLCDFLPSVRDGFKKKNIDK
jgi:hypothetical protein